MIRKMQGIRHMQGIRNMQAIRNMQGIRNLQGIRNPKILNSLLLWHFFCRRTHFSRQNQWFGAIE